jgi:hypothetical protein
VFGEHSAALKGRGAHCRIVEVDQDLITHRAGIEFVNLPERVQALILQFIDGTSETDGEGVGPYLILRCSR